jgi:POT family proton-dependent oligopeptide transporter
MASDRPDAATAPTPDLGGGDAAVATPDTRFFGHPLGLATLFFTELWERFSYYGMRALLVLFMTAAAAGANPGLGLDVGTATAIYGLYTFFVYVLSLPGGWVADNMWGQRRAVFVGGVIIALGHFTMAGPLVGLPDEPTFYLGLIFIVIGTGLLKPNVSSMVGDLYPEGGARRDAGFSIFYMGINLGAILGPLLCGILAETGVGAVGLEPNWHAGFSLAGFGMLAGLISYRLGAGVLGDAGALRTDDDAATLA